MADITQLPTAPQRLTSAHRCLMARIQDLCVDVSQRRDDLSAGCAYAGHVQTLTVHTLPRAHRSPDEGGNGSYLPDWRVVIDLPDGVRGYRSADRALAELTTAIEHLERLLPPAGGAA